MAEYKWSSCNAHMLGEDDLLVKVSPLWEITPCWHDLLATDPTEDERKAICRHERTGRPLGDDNFSSIILMI